jgi:hypothetical protein
MQVSTIFKIILKKSKFYLINLFFIKNSNFSSKKIFIWELKQIFLRF